MLRFTLFNLRAAPVAACLSLLSTLALSLASQAPARADYSEVILHTFQNGTGDGEQPEGGLIQAPDGTLYGTTAAGGRVEDGTVYEIDPAGNYFVLHEFGDGSTPNDGVSPTDTLTLGSDGSLYGTTQNGGDYGAGTVFKMTPDGTVTILHSFSGDTDGGYPIGGLVFGNGSRTNSGKLFGVTRGDQQSSSAAYGTIFSVGTDGSNYAIWYRFGPSNGPTVGELPDCTLTPNPNSAYGGFYGTTQFGGSADGGTVFNFVLPKSGTIGKLTVLHTFADGSVTNDGDSPEQGQLQLDSSGNLYGETFFGGSYAYGTVFKLAPDKTVTTLHSFGGHADGSLPIGGLTLGSDGNYYGTTKDGGAYDYLGDGGPGVSGDGTVFAISPDGSAYGVIYNFGDTGQADGAYPFATVLEDSDGNLVGATIAGGVYTGSKYLGVIYKLLSGLPHEVALTGLSLDQTSVTGGQTNATATVTLDHAAPGGGGAVVTLTSSNPSAAGVPDSVTVPANSKQATFPVTSHAISSSTDVTITASYNGGAQTATLTVTPVPVTLKSVTLSPASTPGGVTTTANRVYFTADATNAAVVSLKSSNTAVATVPGTITFETGHSSRTFTITTKAVTKTTTVTITATYNGATQSATLTVTPPPVTLKSVTLSPTSTKGGTSTTANRVYLTADAPADTSVALSSSNTAIATVNSSVTVTQGTTSHTFTVRTKPVTTTQTVTITAMSGGVTQTATLTVTP